ncbi:MAG TPA: hypothetical protein VM054_11975 [bacterium]|nr:hypothetical protein [bacterium]
MHVRLALFIVLLVLPAAILADEYEVYVGGPDSGLDLVYRDGKFVCGWPGGVLWTREFIPFEGCCNEILLIPLPHADAEVISAAESRLTEFGDIYETMEAVELEAVHDPGAVVWVVRAEPAISPESILRMAQYLRAKAGLVREGWLGFVSDRGLALTGWGALFVEIEDGTLTGAEYQPYDYSPNSQLREWGVIGPDEEYSDHPEANGIAEWLTADGISPIVEGTFTLGYAVKFE